MIASKNYYIGLLCRPGDDAETLKSAYRSIVKRTHSDANEGSEKYRVLFEAAVESWDVLGDPKKREQYDAARDQYLYERGAVWCEGCGEGLRVPNGKGLRCPLCKTPVEDSQPEPQPHSGAWKASVVEPLVESGVRIGDTVLDASEREAERLGRELVRQSATLLSSLIVSGFASARRRLKRKGGSR